MNYGFVRATAASRDRNRADGTPTERFLTPAPPVNVLLGAKYTF